MQLWRQSTGKRSTQYRGGVKIDNLNHHPEPDYPYCNKGHRLQEVFSERHNSFIWDCPTCIEKQRKFYEEEGIL